MDGALAIARLVGGCAGVGVAEAEADDTSSRVHVETVFGSNKRRIMSKTFQGGNAAAVFGEVRLDLSQAEIADDQAVLHADAVFGRVEREGQVVHVLAGRLADLSPMLGDLQTRSRDFH